MEYAIIAVVGIVVLLINVVSLGAVAFWFIKRLKEVETKAKAAVEDFQYYPDFPAMEEFMKERYQPLPLSGECFALESSVPDMKNEQKALRALLGFTQLLETDPEFWEELKNPWLVKRRNILADLGIGGIEGSLEQARKEDAEARVDLTRLENVAWEEEPSEAELIRYAQLDPKPTRRELWEAEMAYTTGRDEHQQKLENARTRVQRTRADVEHYENALNRAKTDPAYRAKEAELKRIDAAIAAIDQLRTELAEAQRAFNLSTSGSLPPPAGSSPRTPPLGTPPGPPPMPGTPPPPPAGAPFNRTMFPSPSGSAPPAGSAPPHSLSSPPAGPVSRKTHTRLPAADAGAGTESTATKTHVHNGGYFCTHCSAPYDPAKDARCPRCKKPIVGAGNTQQFGTSVQEAGHCPDCGQEFTVGQKFCVGCGKDIISLSAAPQAQGIALAEGDEGPADAEDMGEARDSDILTKLPPATGVH